MNKKVLKFVKLFIVFIILAVFVWFLILSPIITFHNNEKKVEDAARRYFELNSEQLPTGERVKTLSLSVLYQKSYLDDDIYSPYSSTKVCSGDNSWIKVKKEKNSDYKYYVYLDCGILKSSIDHEGPVIKLKGEKEITVDYGSKFKDDGVSSVIDKVDGKISKEKVKVEGDVDTSKVGTYEIKYTATDSLSNSTTVTRYVTVVKSFGSTIKNKLNEASNFIGNPTDNYVLFSNIMYRIYGVDDNNNVIIVTEEDISNVSYTKIDKWLEYFESHITDDSKKLLVKSKFCNMKIDANSLDTTQCNSYTKERYSYIPSIIEINRTLDSANNSFLKIDTISWTANAKDDKIGYTTRMLFFGEETGNNYSEDPLNYNYGIRPMVVIDGKTLITGGNGTKDNPYVFGDVKKAKTGASLNTRYSGEYFEDSTGTLWRIIDVEDNLTKAITYSVLGLEDDEFGIISESGSYIYDPTDKNNYAYFITNKSSEYIDTSILQTHEFEVPIYKNRVIYGKEIDVKKYKVKFAAPDIFEMFSATTPECRSYWFRNSSQNVNMATALMDIGVPTNEEVPDYWSFGVRIVGYVKSKYVISSGDGTISSPYKIN